MPNKEIDSSFLLNPPDSVARYYGHKRKVYQMQIGETHAACRPNHWKTQDPTCFQSDSDFLKDNEIIAQRCKDVRIKKKTGKFSVVVSLAICSRTPLFAHSPAMVEKTYTIISAITYNRSIRLACRKYEQINVYNLRYCFRAGVDQPYPCLIGGRVWSTFGCEA